MNVESYIHLEKGDQLKESHTERPGVGDYVHVRLGGVMFMGPPSKLREFHKLLGSALDDIDAKLALAVPVPYDVDTTPESVDNAAADSAMDEAGEEEKMAAVLIRDDRFAPQ